MTEKLLRFNKSLDKAETKKFVDWFVRNYGSIRTVKLMEEIKVLGFIHATKSGVSIGLDDFKIPPLKRNREMRIEKQSNLLEKRIRTGRQSCLKKIRRLDETWQRINDLMGEEVKTNFKQSDLLNPVYMMVFSGARGNFVQVKQLVGIRGFFVNSRGDVLEFPVKSNLTEGLNISEYFTSCYGARKGIIDTALKTADAGYLTRRLVYAGQSQIIKKTNCFTKVGQLILIKKSNKEKYNLLEEKLIGRIVAKDIYDPKTKKILASQGQGICKYVVKKLLQVKRIYIRTPLNCKLNTGVCQLCYGWNLGTGQIVDLGESVGTIAAQSIGEPGTQLTMRTFHTGGVFISKNKVILQEKGIFSPHDGIVSYNTKNGKKYKNRYGESIFLALKTKKIIISFNEINKSVLKIPKYAILFVKPYEKVFKKQIIGEYKNNKRKPYKNPKPYLGRRESFTPITGLIRFEKREKKLSVKEIGEKIRVWLFVGNIITYNSFLDHINNFITRKTHLNFNSSFQKNKKMDKKSYLSVFPLKINYKTFTSLSRFNKKYKKIRKVQRNYRIIKKSKEDKEFFITDNYEHWIEVRNNNIKLEKKLGKIFLKGEELYDNFKNCYTGKVIEVRKNKLCMINLIRFFIRKDEKVKYNDNDILHHDYPTGSEDFFGRETSSDIIQGLPKVEKLLEARNSPNLEDQKNNPNEILKNEFVALSKKYKNPTAVRKSFEKIQEIIITRVQDVYKEQQINIADKHIEIMVKQMTSKAMIIGNGDSNFIVGEILEVNRIEKINKKLKNKIKYEPILIGISKVSLSHPSFLSQASFQETTRILARSAIEGKIDWLYGIKENLILGNLIPIGTGFKNL